MTVDWWTLGLQTVNVIILIWILARFLFRPVTRIISERQAAAHAALDDAQAARDEAKAAQDKVNAEAEAAAAHRADLIAAARAEADGEKERLLADARHESDALRAQAKADLARLRHDQQKAVEAQAGALAADIAGKLVARLPNSVRVSGFLDGLIDAVATLPEATRAAIGAAGPVQVRAARALTQAERTSLCKRLATVLGRDVDIESVTAPDLIAGLELDADTAIVANHLRADLDRIERELRADG